MKIMNDNILVNHYTRSNMKIKDLLKLSPKELTDMGVCPTCLNKKYNGAIFGDDSNLLLYTDDEIEIAFVPNPRAQGHMMIGSQKHYHDMSEAPDSLNAKMICFAKQCMKILKKVYSCERVYLCTMCDGPANHYHLQLIPRFANEERGSLNFVKPRTDYIFNAEKFATIKKKLATFAKTYEKKNKA